MEDFDILLDDLYGKYANKSLTEEQRSTIKNTYGGDVDTLLKDFYGKYANEELSEDKISYIKDTYGLKKKENLESSSQGVSADSTETSEVSSVSEDKITYDNKKEDINNLLDGFNSYVEPTEEDLQKAEEEAEKELSGDFGFLDKIKRMYSSASLANPSLPNYLHTDPNLKERIEVTKQLAEEEGVSTDDIPQSKVNEILKENKKNRVLQSIKDKKTEEYIETLPEEEKNKIKNILTEEVSNLSAKSQNKLIQAEKLKSDYLDIVSELEEIQEAHSPDNIYGADYYAKNLSLVDKAKEILSEYETSIDDFQNNQDDLSEFSNELDLFKRNYSDWDNFWGKLSNSASQLGLNMAYLLNKTNELNPVTMGSAKSLENLIIQSKERLGKQSELLRRNKSVEDLSTAEDVVEWALDLVAEQTPNTVLMATTGGASLPLMGASAAGGKLYELDKEDKSGVSDYSELEKYGSAFLTGTAEALSEKISLGQINKAKRVLGTIGERELKDSASEYFKKTFKKDGLLKYVKDITEEGGSEAISQLAENITDKYLLGKDVNLTDGLTDAFASGAFMSGVIYKMPQIGKHLSVPFIQKDINQKIGENQSKIEAITKQLNNGLSEEAEKTLLEERKALVKKNKYLYDSSVAQIDEFTDEEINDLLEIEKDKFDLRKKAKAIKEEVKMDDSVKESTLKKINEELSELENEKESVLNEALDKPMAKDIDSFLDEAFEEFESLSEDDSKEAVIRKKELTDQINEAVALRSEVNANKVNKIPKSFVEEATKQFDESGNEDQINERAIELYNESRKKEIENIRASNDIDIAETLKLKELTKNIETAKKNLKDFSDNTLGVNIPVAVAQASLTAMEVSLKSATKVADVISEGLNAIKKTGWYKNLSDSDKSKVEASFMKRANNTFNEFVGMVTDRSELSKKLLDAEIKERESRKKLKSFKTRIKNREDASKEAVKYVKEALSPNEFKKLNKREFNNIVQQIRDVKTNKGLSKLIDKVTDIVDEAVVRNLNDKFNKLLRSKKVGSNKKALLDQFAVDVLNLLTKGEFLDKTYAELDKIESKSKDEAVHVAVNVARYKKKSDNARRKDMSRVHMEAAVEELKSAIEKGRSNIQILKYVYEAEKERRLELARTETSRKTKEERAIITSYKKLKKEPKLKDEVLSEAIALIDKMKRSYSSMDTTDALNKIYNVSTKEDFDRILSSVFNEYSSKADFKSRHKKAVSLGRTVVDALTRVSFDIATIVSFISKKGSDSMLGGFLHESITHDTRRAVNEFGRLKEETLKKVNTKLKEVYGKVYPKAVMAVGDLMPSIMEDTNAKVKTGEFDEDGYEFALSRGEMIWLYNQYKNPKAKVHFEAKGITEDKMESLVNKIMTKEDIEFADWLVEDFYPEMYPVINSVYKKIHFRNMPISQFYAGQLQFDIDDKTKRELTNPEGWNKEATALFFGSGIERINHKYPISTHTNAMTNLMHYVEESSRFVASAETYRNIMEILNDNEVKTNLANYTSNRVHKNLKDAVEFAFGFKPENTSSGIINFLVHSKILASLGFTPKLAVTQLMSTSLWLTDNPMEIMKNINNVGNVKLLREIYDNSFYIRERYKTNPAALEASYVASRSKVMNRYRSMRLLTRANDSLFKIALSFIRLGDAAGMFVLGIPYYAQAKKEGLEKFKGDEAKAIKYAVDKFETVASKTQQSYASHDRDFMQHTGVGKVFNMYANSPKQYFRNSIQALLELSRKTRGRETKGSIPQNFRKFMLNHVVQGVLYQWVGTVMLGLISTDDEEQSKLKDIIAKGALMGSFNKFFILGDIIEGLWDAYNGKAYASNSDLAMMSSVTSINKELIKLKAAEDKGDEVAIQEHLAKIAQHSADVLGIPASKVKSMLNNADKLINEHEKMSDGEFIARLLNYSEYALDNLDGETRKKSKEKQQQKAIETRKRRKAIEDRKNKIKKPKKVTIKR